MKPSKLDTNYVCTGENYTGYTQIGFCGDVHTLREWLSILFPGEDVLRYFENAESKAALEYILIHKGKRLQKM